MHLRQDFKTPRMKRRIGRISMDNKFDFSSVIMDNSFAPSTELFDTFLLKMVSLFLDVRCLFCLNVSVKCFCNSKRWEIVKENF